MIYGYARVSTKGQAKDGNSLAEQERKLKEAGATEIYKDSFTGTKSNRPEFSKLLDVIGEGDTLIVCKLDRFARSAKQGIELIDALIAKGVTVNILNMGVLDSSPSGKLVRTIFFAFAEFERDMIVERTGEGKAIAKEKEGFTEGRPQKFDKDQIAHAMELLKTHSYSQVVKLTGISKSTLIRAAKK